MSLDNNFTLDQLNTPMWKILISSFVAHGFLDFITFLPQVTNNLSWYTSYIILFTLLMVYLPSIAIIGFIGISMYHFGEDFRYLFKPV